VIPETLQEIDNMQVTTYCANLRENISLLKPVRLIIIYLLLHYESLLLLKMSITDHVLPRKNKTTMGENLLTILYCPIVQQEGGGSVQRTPIPVRGVKDRPKDL